MQIRQGDVLLVPVDKLPVGAVEVTIEGDIVLKYGEATGHAHRIADARGKVRVWDAGAERFLQVIETASLRHEEHGAIDIVPGLYHIPDQVEWTDEDELRVVAD